MNANAARRETRRAWALAQPQHLVARPGDGLTYCGQRANEAPTGWAGVNDEFLVKRIGHGQVICGPCLAAHRHARV